MKTEVFYCKSGMHVRPMRFSILFTPTDSSDKTQMMCSTILLCLYTSKYDINGSQARNQGGGIWGICPPLKFSKRCIAILTFAKTFK